MIVRPLDAETLLLIRQPDHAALARRVMERCVPLANHARRDAILLAVEQHDNGWDAEDASPTVDAAGVIEDFIHLPLPRRHAVWPRGIDRLAARDAWAAALVAHHAWTVYGRFRESAEWTAFFADLVARRTAYLATSGLPLAALEADYPFLRVGDLVSLGFCTGETGEQRIGEWSVRGEGSRVLVTPDPFAGAAVPLAITGRRLARRPYADDADLRAALAAAPRGTLQGTAAGA